MSLAFWIDRLRVAGFDVLLDGKEAAEKGCPFPLDGLEGASFGRIIYLSKDATIETAIHEYAHRWLQALRNRDERSWKALSDYVMTSRWYAFCKRLVEEETLALEESLASAIGQLGAERVLGIKRSDNAGLRKVAHRVMDDLLSGIFPKGGVLVWMRQIVGISGAIHADRSFGVTLREDALRMAEKWERLGKTPEEIRASTGWERWLDGEWRYESADTALSLEGQRYLQELRRAYPPLPDRVTSSSIQAHIRPIPVGRHTLSFFFPKATLYHYYPGLRDITVCPIRGFQHRLLKAGYAKNEQTIYMDVTLGKAETIRCFHHELQHAIQSTEGWSMGLDWDMAQELYGESREILQRMHHLWREWQSRYGIPDWHVLMDERMKALFSGYLLELPDEMRGLPFTKQRWIIDRRANLKENEREECLRVIDGLRHKWYRDIRIDILRFSSGRELFHRSTGEIEARVAAARYGLDPKTRRSLSLRETIEPSLRSQPLLLTRRVGDVEQISVLQDW